jgi:hypothetical protein
MRWKVGINWRKEQQDSDGKKGKHRFMKCDMEREAIGTVMKQKCLDCCGLLMVWHG